MALPRFRKTPHLRMFLAPKAYDARVDMPPLIPRMTDCEIMLTNMFPRPIPAILAESSVCAIKSMLTRSIISEKTRVMIAGKATLDIFQTIVEKGSLSSAINPIKGSICILFDNDSSLYFRDLEGAYGILYSKFYLSKGVVPLRWSSILWKYTFIYYVIITNSI